MPVPQSPLFSLVMANYNNARFIETAVNSVLAQSYPDWELVIVDDGSTDDSVNIIQRLAASEKRIRFYRNDKNHGCGYTKKRAIELASGSLIGVLDPDDALMPEALAVSVRAHQLHPDVGLVYSNCYKCDENLEILAPRIARPVPVGKNYLESLGLPGVMLSHFISFKKEKYELTAGLDVACKRAVDQDLFLKMEEVAPLLHIKDVLYKYRFHANGLSTGSGTLKALSWFVYVIIETCKRRKLNFEDYVPEMFNREIIQKLQQGKDYKTGNAVLRPFRFLKKKFFRVK